MRQFFEFNIISFFYTKTAAEKCSESRKGFSFVSIYLIELFANSFESRDRALLGERKVV
jgi:hypothetical protein